MVKIDLITGFLGSGKTTFLRKYASYLITQGQNIGILENDFGAVNVDMMLLGDLRGDNCELEMISGGCDADTHRRRFKTKLISMGMCGYDRVIVEPSGIYDVDEFFDTLHEEPLDGWYEIGNVITVLDSNLEENLPESAEFLLASQAADAGCIVLSKTQETTEEEQKKAVSHLNRALKNIRCKRQFEEVFSKDWEQMTDRILWLPYGKLPQTGFDTGGNVSVSLLYEYAYDRRTITGSNPKTVLRQILWKSFSYQGIYEK